LIAISFFCSFYRDKTINKRILGRGRMGVSSVKTNLSALLPWNFNEFPTGLQLEKPKENLGAG